MFTCFSHQFQLDLDETSFLFNEVELEFIWSKYKPFHEKNCRDSMFSITVLWVGIAAGVNVPVIFLENGKKVYPRIRGTNLVTRYGLLEGSCVIPNKAAYMVDQTWEKVVKVVYPVIIKNLVINVAYVCPILLSFYITLHICPSELSSDDLLFTKAVVIPHI